MAKVALAADEGMSRDCLRGERQSKAKAETTFAADKVAAEAALTGKAQGQGRVPGRVDGGRPRTRA